MDPPEQADDGPRGELDTPEQEEPRADGGGGLPEEQHTAHHEPQRDEQVVTDTDDLVTSAQDQFLVPERHRQRAAPIVGFVDVRHVPTVPAVTHRRSAVRVNNPAGVCPFRSSHRHQPPKGRAQPSGNGSNTSVRTALKAFPDKARPNAWACACRPLPLRFPQSARPSALITFPFTRDRRDGTDRSTPTEEKT